MKIPETMKDLFKKRGWASCAIINQNLQKEDFYLFNSPVLGIKFDGDKVTLLLETYSVQINISSLHCLIYPNEDLGPRAFVPLHGCNIEPQVIIMGEIEELKNLFKNAGFAHFDETID